MTETGPSPASPWSWRTARSLAFATATSGSGVLLLVLLIVAGRWLGDADYGRFSFALALATVLETLVDFGLKEVATRTVARDRGAAARLVRHTLALKLVVGVVVLLLLVVIARTLRPEPEVRFACYVLGVSSIFRSLLLTFRHTLNGLERYGLESLVVIADRGFLLVFGVAALLGGYGVTGLALAFAIGRFAAFGLAYGIARSQVGPIGLGYDVGYWRELQREALPFGAFVVVLNLYAYIGTLMLGLLATDAETGLYSAASRIYEGLTNLPIIIATVAGPKLARLFVEDPARHRRLAGLALGSAVALAAPVVVIGIPLSRWLLTLLFGAEFAGGAPALQVLIVGLLVVFPLQILHPLAISVNAEKQLVWAAALSCLANVLLNIVAIPRYGAVGAAAAMVVSETIGFAWILAGVYAHVVKRPRAAEPTD